MKLHTRKIIFADKFFFAGLLVVGNCESLTVTSNYRWAIDFKSPHAAELLSKLTVNRYRS